MFDKLIKRAYYAKKHREVPLLNEQIAYVQQCVDTNHARSTSLKIDKIFNDD